MRAMLFVVLASAVLCGGALSAMAQSGRRQNSNQARNENSNQAQTDNSNQAKNENQNSSLVGEKIYSSKEVDSKAVIKKRPNPSYTMEAREHDIHGIVALSAVLSSDGKVTDIKEIIGLPFGLTEKAIEAARKIKFVPAMKDGLPVSTRVRIEYFFALY